MAWVIALSWLDLIKQGSGLQGKTPAVQLPVKHFPNQGQRLGLISVRVKVDPDLATISSSGRGVRARA